MTDRQKQMIESYLPHPKDETLKENEYYVLDTADRVRKVYIRSIFCHSGDREDTYDCYEVSTGRRIDAGWDDIWIGFRRGELYDNKQDCKDRTHSMYAYWEELRKVQDEH